MPHVLALLVRPAVATDAAAVAVIYNAGIAERVATFETEPRDAAAVAARIAATAPPYDFLVADAGGEILGWAATFPYSSRACYAGVAEFSVYVDPAARGRGAARALLDTLAVRAEAAGLHKLTGRVFVTNDVSRALCARAGFHEVGVHRRHARLDGDWVDVVTVERLLGDAAQ